MAQARVAIDSVVDLDRYPICTPDSAAYVDLLEQCREGLRTVGCFSVPDFFRPEAVVQIRNMYANLLSDVYRPTDDVSPYGGDDDATLPADHPRRQRFRRGGGFVCADQLDASSDLWVFFNAPEITAFMEDAFEIEPLYQYGDPLASMASNVMWNGDTFPWHFDTNEMTVSIMIQPPEAGGVFEYIPNIRTPQSENFEAVREIFNGSREGVRQLILKPGDMQLFRGRYTLHRVSEVEGDIPRIVALPSWSSKPDQVGVVERMQRSYGRALPIHYERAGITPDQLPQ